MRRLLVGLMVLAAGCSTPAPEAPSGEKSAPPPVAASAPEPAGEVAVPPATRDPFNKRVDAPRQPATQPMKRAGVDYVKPARDPFVNQGGKPRAATGTASQAADPDAGSRIARPTAPDWKVLSVNGDKAEVSAPTGTLTVRAGDFVLGCRVQSVDAKGITVTRSGVPFRLDL